MPIDALPNDVLGRIFQELIYGDFTDSPVAAMDHRSTIICVSPLWFGVALGECGLWSVIYVGPTTNHESLRRCIAYGAEHAATLQFDCDGYPEFIDWALHILRPVFLRCVDFTLRSRVPSISDDILNRLSAFLAPSLRSLYLDIRPEAAFIQRRMQTPVGCGFPFIFQGTLPNLRTLHFIGAWIVWPSPLYYQTLLDIRLSGLEARYEPILQEIYALLHAASGVRRLTLESVGCSNFRTNAVILAPPILSQLTHLAIDTLPAFGIQMLSSLHMPALTTLSWFAEAHQGGDIMDILYQCRATFCSLSTLILTIAPNYSMMLAQILMAFPAVRQLDLRRCSRRIAQTFQAVLLQWLSVLPLIEEVSLSGSMTDSEARRFLTTTSRAGTTHMRLIVRESDSTLALTRAYSVVEGAFNSVIVTRPIDYWSD
ncbi:hypothetical protein C8R43DRAFT_1136135 [Mycena crocata]|nr:hypothetical protein C8R43DRAFT_1136135 [Mycena crocata]